jgi:hypothetical protein
MGRKRIQNTTTRFAGVEWDYSCIGTTCAVLGCTQAADGYMTCIRPSPHVIGALWFAPICSSCSRSKLGMAPLTFLYVQMQCQYNLPAIAKLLNISGQEAKRRTAEAVT